MGNHDRSKRWTALAEKGKLEAIFRDMKAGGKLAMSPPMLEKVKALFPPGPPVPIPDQIPDGVVATSDLLLIILKKKRHRAPGLSGMTAGNILGACDSAPLALSKFTKFINLFTRGFLPADLVCLIKARGIALPKGSIPPPPELPQIRPLGVPELFMGVAGAVVVYEVKKLRKEAFEPLQLGLASRGTEIAIHLVNQFVDTNADRTDMSVGENDYKNAYGIAGRPQMIPEVIERLPRSAPLTLMTYAKPSQVLYDGYAVEISGGLIQGDELGPDMFASSSIPILEKLDAMMKESQDDSLTVGIFDDMTCCGQTSVVAKSMAFLDPSPPPEFGQFVLNKLKSLVIPTCLRKGLAPDPPPKELPPGVVYLTLDIPEKNGGRFLGSGIGSPEYKAAFLRNRVDSKLIPLLTLIKTLPNPHLCLHLIRRSIQFTGLTHCLRTTAPWEHWNELARVDTLIKDALECSVFQANLSPTQWRIVQQPIEYGGWGFPSFQHQALCGYYASLSTNRAQLITIRDCGRWIQSQLDKTAELLKPLLPSSRSLVENEKYTQRELFGFIAEAEKSKLFDHAVKEDPRFAVILHSQSMPKSGLWKIAPPHSHSLMPSSKFLIAAQRSVRLPVYSEKFYHNGVLFGLYGDEALSLRKGGYVTLRHNAVRDFLHEVGCEGAVTQAKERTLVLEDLSTYRADIFYRNGLPGVASGPLATDITFTNETCLTEINQAARTQGKAALDGERHKDSRHAHQVELDQVTTFLPLSFECFGGHNELANPLYYHLIKARATRQEVSLSESASKFWTDLSFLIQFYNSLAIEGAQKDYVNTHIDGLRDSLPPSPP